MKIVGVVASSDGKRSRGDWRVSTDANTCIRLRNFPMKNCRFSTSQISETYIPFSNGANSRATRLDVCRDVRSSNDKCYDL